MKKRIHYILLISVILQYSCENNTVKKLKLSQPSIVHLHKLSSASGISNHNETLFIVGDDIPWLYELDENLKIIDSTKISGVDSSYEGRTPKFLKSDFESTEIILDDYVYKIIIISSGSVMHTRDTAYMVDIEKKEKILAKNLRPLYEEIKLQSKLHENNEINIEGTAFSDDHAFLIHRGNVSENLIIETNRNAFLDYIKNNAPIPDFKIYRFNLPVYKGVSAGFSGVSMLPDKSGLLFTASMEDTGDEVNDGAVLGSYIGIIPFSGIQNGEYSAELLMLNNSILAKKLEGITVLPNSGEKELNVVTVCDNDDGTSDILTFSIKPY